jgi:Helix-turn-helix domain
VSAAAVLLRLPGTDTELRHGYTLAQVSQLSVQAVRAQHFHQAADFDDRVEVAWHAMIEHIYSAAQPPAEQDVMYAGWRAVSAHVRGEEQFRGRNRRDWHAGVTAGFERYWWTTARNTPGPEERVIEQVALAQIWPMLRPLHRQVLAALAAHDDYGRAAAALGKSRRTFTSQVGKARRAFFDLWHQGETPSRPWGHDRRRTTITGGPTITYRAITGRRANRARSAARSSGRPQSARRPGPLRADLGISDTELGRRYENGQSIRQLAASLGCSYEVIRQRLHAQGAQVRSMGRPGRPGTGGPVPSCALPGHRPAPARSRDKNGHGRVP